MKVDLFTQNLKNQMENPELTEYLGNVLRAEMIERLISKKKSEKKKINNFSKIINNIILEYLNSQNYKLTEGIFLKEAKLFQKMEKLNIKKDTFELILSFFNKNKNYLRNISSESIIELILKNLFEKDLKEDKETQTVQINSEINEILSLDEKFNLIDEKFQIENSKIDPLSYMEKKLEKIKKNCENEYKEKYERFVNSEKISIFNEIKYNLKEEFEKRKKELEKIFLEKKNHLKEREKNVNELLKNKLEEIKKDYDQKMNNFEMYKNIEIKKIELKKNELEEIDITIKERKTFVSYLSETVEKRKCEISKKEKKMEIEIYNEIEKAKYETLKDVEKKKKLVDIKLKLVDDEFDKIREIKNDLKKMDEEKKKLEIENFELKRKFTSEINSREELYQHQKNLKNEIFEIENSNKEMSQMIITFKFQLANCKNEKNHLEKMLLDYKEIILNKSREVEKVKNEADRKIEEFKFLIAEMKQKFLENEVLNLQINSEKDKEPLEDFYNLIKKNQKNKKEFLVKLNKNSNNENKSESNKEKFENPINDKTSLVNVSSKVLKNISEKNKKSIQTCEHVKNSKSITELNKQKIIFFEEKDPEETNFRPLKKNEETIKINRDWEEEKKNSKKQESLEDLSIKRSSGNIASLVSSCFDKNKKSISGNNNKNENFSSESYGKFDSEGYLDEF